MYKIRELFAREVLDSRWNPTVEVELSLETKEKLWDSSYDVMWSGRSIVPSGASTWVHEAVELRDGDLKRYGGKWVLKAVKNVNTLIKRKILDQWFSNYRELDRVLLALDGTKNKSHLWANAILWVSMAFVQAVANLHNIPVYRVLGEEKYRLPIPMMNILNGWKHADNNVDIQEFMIVPLQASWFSERLRMWAEVFHILKNILEKKWYLTSVGDEWWYAPNLSSNEEAFQLIVEAIEMAWYTTEQIKIAIDAAATWFYDKDKNIYRIDGQELWVEALARYYKKMMDTYPIFSLEDGFAEDDFDGRAYFESQYGQDTMTVWDDLLVTNVERIRYALDQKLCNSALIKPNQIWTVSETLDAIALAQKNDMRVIISHRSGETEDTFIADLAVAVGSDYIKTWSLSRSERIAKYNQLLRIEEKI